MNLPSIFSKLFKKKDDSKTKMQRLLTGPTVSQLSVANAQSWNPETHPNGRGSSYLVDEIDYDGESKELVVKYRNGFTAKYEGITSKQALEFSSADSKGRWALKNLWDKPYTAV